jgi:putative phosphoesterase
MRIGIISDTHHNEEYTKRAVRYLIDEGRAEVIYHLGDEWEDIPAAEREGAKVVTVPGIYAEQYKDPAIPNKIVEEVKGVKVILTHDIDDLTEEEIAANDVILHGHTHSYELRLTLNKLFINPGHLKEEYHKDRIATFCLLKVGRGGVKAKIFDINFNVIAKINKRS